MFKRLKSLIFNEIGRRPRGGRAHAVCAGPPRRSAGAVLPRHSGWHHRCVGAGRKSQTAAPVRFSRSLRLSGDESKTIVAHMKRAYNLMIGESTAEELKLHVGSAFPLVQELTMDVKGRDLSAGLPKTPTVRSNEIRETLQESTLRPDLIEAMEDGPFSSILESVGFTIERRPPEFSADLVDRGIPKASGAARLRDTARLVAKESGRPVHIADDPLNAFAGSTGLAGTPISQAGFQ
jgi:rod shape-determining protein MreB